MIYIVMRELHDSCVDVKRFGTRQSAEAFIAKQRKPLRAKLSIREAHTNPRFPLPYLPGVGH